MRHGAERALVGLGVLALLMGAGCTSKDEGVTVTDQDAAALRAKAAANVEKQIADIEKDPNIPAAQKKQIISQIKAGAARATQGSQSGMSGATKK